SRLLSCKPPSTTSRSLPSAMATTLDPAPWNRYSPPFSSRDVMSAARAAPAPKPIRAIMPTARNTAARRAGTMHVFNGMDKELAGFQVFIRLARHVGLQRPDLGLVIDRRADRRPGGLLLQLNSRPGIAQNLGDIQARGMAGLQEGDIAPRHGVIERGQAVRIL